MFTLSVAEFEDIVNAEFKESNLKDGYAPFCKHIFLENTFTAAKVNVLPLTKDNEGLVRTAYQARNEKEVPVLQRSIPLELIGGEEKLPGMQAVEAPVFLGLCCMSLTLLFFRDLVAKYLDLILYSREQIRKENESMGKPAGDEVAPWGIVSIKAQDVDYELPMNPITIMRNSLGKDQGGSGVPLDRDAYMESVNYWKENVVVS